MATRSRAVDRATARRAPFSPARPTIRRSTSNRVPCTRAAKEDNNQDGNGEYSKLEARIASGEFTDTGSTKEKITRPLRKALAEEPTGVGE
jgi:hypothetical protein